MNKTLLRKAKDWLKNGIFIFFLQILGIIIFISSKLVLPTPPGEVPINIIGLLGVLVFYIGLVVQLVIMVRAKKLKKLVNILISITLFSLALVFSLFATHPVSKLTQDALIETEKNINAVLRSNEIGTQVKTNQITKDEATNMISTIYANEPEVKSIAQQSLESTVNTSKTLEEIKRDVYPTIPINPNYWSCTEIACSYSDATRIWTISNSNRVIGMLISISSFGAIMLIVNEDKLKYVKKI